MHQFVQETLHPAYADGGDLLTESGEALLEFMGKEDISLVVTDLSEYSGQYGHLLATG